ncbi:uncharacterized protein LOC110832783 isoform X2 [Zootermopsis nevadensis]|uniref:uncharacterized protein LOC110832783 isoform X2 n=1 Tax=Zootermopsis nevadensis TaxID=136037 RepID=UPI000B8E91EE|nr:uncharacterized protein LOC110832783 isoform X2 [Zootermopsis nevadensis]
MAVQQSGVPVLIGVSILSLFLALSVYYMVDNITRPSEDKEHITYSTEKDNGPSENHKTTNPLTEFLYQQLFQRKAHDVCPVYLANVCRWNLQKDDNGIKSYKNTTKQKLKQFHGIIRLCQVFGTIKYQDVCFYVGNSLLEHISENGIVSQIFQDCVYINDNGYPCLIKSKTESDYLAPRNACVSDSTTVINVLTKRCRFREESYLNDSNFMPFEDLIYEVENDNYRNENGRTTEENSANAETGDSNQQYKSGNNKTQTGTNATTVVCHVLLAALLVVSASVALFEVCRDRLSNKQLGQQSIIGDGRINAIGSHSSLLDNRRCSLADLTASRHVRRESIQQVIPREPSSYNTSSTVAPLCPQTKLLGKCSTTTIITPQFIPNPHGRCCVNHTSLFHTQRACPDSEWISNTNQIHVKEDFDGWKRG